jgi:hypothetical protein
VIDFAWDGAIYYTNSCRACLPYHQSILVLISSYKACLPKSISSNHLRAEVKHHYPTLRRRRLHAIEPQLGVDHSRAWVLEIVHRPWRPRRRPMEHVDDSVIHVAPWCREIICGPRSAFFLYGCLVRSVVIRLVRLFDSGLSSAVFLMNTLMFVYMVLTTTLPAYCGREVGMPLAARKDVVASVSVCNSCSWTTRSALFRTALFFQLNLVEKAF